MDDLGKFIRSNEASKMLYLDKPHVKNAVFGVGDRRMNYHRNSIGGTIHFVSFLNN
jgi:hypothetical protein